MNAWFYSRSEMAACLYPISKAGFWGSSPAGSRARRKGTIVRLPDVRELFAAGNGPDLPDGMSERTSQWRRRGSSRASIRTAWSRSKICKAETLPRWLSGQIDRDGVGGDRLAAAWIALPIGPDAPAVSCEAEEGLGSVTIVMSPQACV